MTPRQSSAEIDERAAEWAALLDGEALSPAERARLDAWLAEDIRHRGAFARAQAIVAHYQDPDWRQPPATAPASAPVSALGALARPGRRAFLLGGGAAAAVAAVAVTHGTARANVYETRKGEIRLIPLEDGSSVTLNTASAIKVRFSARERGVELLAGEAFFDVAPGRDRPFVVRAGKTQVTASSTSFTVRRDQRTPTRVVVRQGVAEVALRGDAAPPVVMTANTAAVAAEDHGIETAAVEPQKVTRDLTWREGILSVEDRPLQEVAAEFARYADPPIVIADAGVGRRTITGAFSANNPSAFAMAAAAVLDLKADVRKDRITLSN